MVELQQFCFGKATAAVCSSQIDEVWLPLRYRAWEKRAIRTALTMPGSAFTNHTLCSLGSFRCQALSAFGRRTQ